MRETPASYYSWSEAQVEEWGGNPIEPETKASQKQQTWDKAEYLLG